MGKIEQHLNVAKCEVITKGHHQCDLDFQGFVNTHPDDACLLGASLGSVRALDNALTLRWSYVVPTLFLRVTISRHKSLPSQDALILLRSSFDAPKIMHTLRTAIRTLFRPSAAL